MPIEKDILGVAEAEYGNQYRPHLLELYKAYVTAAEKISDRRQSANSFFLTLNSVIVSLVGYMNLAHDNSVAPESFAWLIGMLGMVLSFLWYRLIRSYKDINTGKYKVIHAIEQHLPLRLYDAEWMSLGEGKDSRIYLPFTRIEILVPWVFFTIHLLVFILSLLS